MSLYTYKLYIHMSLYTYTYVCIYIVDHIPQVLSPLPFLNPPFLCVPFVPQNGLLLFL